MKLLLVSLIALLLCSCSSVNYSRTEPTGERISFGSQSLFMKRAIKDMDVTSGDRRLLLKGYSTDQAEIMQAAITAALAAFQRMQPTPVPTPTP